MFVNCPHCQALIPTDPATDRPPQRCPRCAAVLREAVEATPSYGSAASMSATNATPTESGVDPAPEDDAVEALASTDDAGNLDDIPEEHAFDSALREPADAIAKAVLGPAAVEVEIASSGERGDSEEMPEAGDSGSADNAFDGDAAVATEPAPSESVPSESVPSEPVPSEPVPSEPVPSEPVPSEPVPSEPVPSDPVPSEPVQNEPAQSEPAPTATQRRGRHAPSFARGQHAAKATSGRGRWTSIAGVVILLLALVLQLLLADRAQLASDARWRPTLSAICGLLRCTLPAWREPAAFTLLDRDVRPHPTVPGALRVHASFRNDARWPQPWPRLQLTLSDVDGRAAGARSFVAREYLGEAPTQNELSSGQSATVSMDILEPAANIVAFTFDFR